MQGVASPPNDPTPPIPDLPDAGPSSNAPHNSPNVSTELVNQSAARADVLKNILDFSMQKSDEWIRWITWTVTLPQFR